MTAPRKWHKKTYADIRKMVMQARNDARYESIQRASGYDSVRAGSAAVVETALDDLIGMIDREYFELKGLHEQAAEQQTDVMPAVQPSDETSVMERVT